MEATDERVVCGFANGRLFVLELGTRAVLFELDRHDSAVQCIAWSPDGTRLAAGYSDGTVRIWDSVHSAIRFARRVAPN